MKQTRMQGFEADLYLRRQKRQHIENLDFSNLITKLGYNKEAVLNREQALQLAEKLGWSIGRVNTVFDRIRNRYKNNIAPKRKEGKPVRIKVKKRLCVSKSVTNLIENKRSNTERNRAKRQRKQRKRG